LCGLARPWIEGVLGKWQLQAKNPRSQQKLHASVKYGTVFWRQPALRSKRIFLRIPKKLKRLAYVLDCFFGSFSFFGVKLAVSVLVVVFADHEISSANVTIAVEIVTDVRQVVGLTLGK